jgi:hypothetical protein
MKREVIDSSHSHRIASSTSLDLQGDLSHDIRCCANTSEAGEGVCTVHATASPGEGQS